MPTERQRAALRTAQFQTETRQALQRIEEAQRTLSQQIVALANQTANASQTAEAQSFLRTFQMPTGQQIEQVYRQHQDPGANIINAVRRSPSPEEDLGAVAVGSSTGVGIALSNVVHVSRYLPIV